jgi:hypothetical protein
MPRSVAAPHPITTARRAMGIRRLIKSALSYTAHSTLQRLPLVLKDNASALTAPLPIQLTRELVSVLLAYSPKRLHARTPAPLGVRHGHTDAVKKDISSSQCHDVGQGFYLLCRAALSRSAASLIASITSVYTSTGRLLSAPTPQHNCS